MANVVASTVDMSRKDWLEERRKGIGGSDVAKVLGVSRWGGPLSVYLDKTGAIEFPEPGEAAYWGTVLEDVVAKEFALRSGLKVRRANKIFCHPDYPWMMANVDREIVGEPKGLECKTASAYFSTEWVDDQIPDAYYLQVQHYMAVMDWTSCWVAALVGGQSFLYKEIPRDEPLIEMIIEQEKEFWLNYVEPGIAPALGIYDDPSLIYPDQKEEELVPADDKLETLGKRLAKLKAIMKAQEEEKLYLENSLKDAIKDKAGIEGIATWKQSKATETLDWKALIKHLDPPQEVTRKFLITKPGSRRFLLKIKE